MVKAEVDPVVHVQQMLNKITGKTKSKPALSQACHPRRQRNKYQKSFNKTAIMYNLHIHSATCRKGNPGKGGCRMRRPPPMIHQTSCTQIVSYFDENGKRTYKAIPKVTYSVAESQRWRIISRLPIPLRDKRLLM